MKPRLEETDAARIDGRVLPAGHLQTNMLSDLQEDNLQDVEPNLARAELCMRPNELPTMLTDVPPVVGALKVPAAGTEMIGVLKLVKKDTLDICWTTDALADTRNPLPKANLHKTVESAFQKETSQVDPRTKAFALLDDCPSWRPNTVNVIEPVTARFEGLAELISGIEKRKKSCTSEPWPPELIRTPLDIPKPAQTRLESDESEVQRDCADAVVPKRMDCDAPNEPM
jgi:hypothetical protein